MHSSSREQQQQSHSDFNFSCCRQSLVPFCFSRGLQDICQGELISVLPTTECTVAGESHGELVLTKSQNNQLDSRSDLCRNKRQMGREALRRKRAGQPVPQGGPEGKKAEKGLKTDSINRACFSNTAVAGILSLWPSDFFFICIIKQKCLDNYQLPVFPRK